MPDNSNSHSDTIIEFEIFIIECYKKINIDRKQHDSLVITVYRSWQTRHNIHSNDKDNNGESKKLSLKDAISASVAKGKLVSGDSGGLSTSASSVPTFANPFWVEMLVISKRSLTNSRRMPELFGIRFGAVLVTGIILATIFRHLDESPKGVQERLGFFAFAMSTTFYTCAEAIPVFLQER